MSGDLITSRAHGRAGGIGSRHISPRLEGAQAARAETGPGR